MKDKALELDTVQLTPKDFDRAADLLADAFYDNPSHAYIFSDRHNRLELLKWGLKANLRLNLASSTAIGHSFALAVSDQSPGMREIRAMGFWYPPQRSPIGLIDKVKSGWAIAPFKFGWQTYQRLLEVMNEMDRIKASVLSSHKSWYLNNMAVAKELRGTGIGTQVLKHQLEFVVEPSGCSAILMTQRAGNVVFYQRLGFQVVTESTVGSGTDAFTNWCMIRHSSQE